MKRKSKFAAFMIAAVATFATLFFTVGKPCYMNHHHACKTHVMHHPDQQEETRYKLETVGVIIDCFFINDSVKSHNNTFSLDKGTIHIWHYLH